MLILYGRREGIAAWIIMHTFATSEVSVLLSVLLKHILRLFRCMYVTAPIGLTLIGGWETHL